MGVEWLGGLRSEGYGYWGMILGLEMRSLGEVFVVVWGMGEVVRFRR